MQLGDLLLAAKLISLEDYEKAAKNQRIYGGRLTENLIAIGAIDLQTVQSFTDQIPVQPRSIAETGISETDLLDLLIKQIQTKRLETPLEFADAIKMPSNIVNELINIAVAKNLLSARGLTGNIMKYELSDYGRSWANNALKTSQYAGPAPVTLEDFCDRVRRQKTTTDVVNFESISRSLANYNFTDTFICKVGPALNSGRAILLYGPPGNGKTTVALSLASVFNSIIFIPYAIMVEGHVIRVFDPSCHAAIREELPEQENIYNGLQSERYDTRWIAVRRPFVMTGGELTLEMLDLRYDVKVGFYEAPLHIKALGGCFVVDDFGRQAMSPADLLNRWIVPMESRVDYLKLHTGKSFSIPFEAMVIFSTNIHPSDLMDGAFLRRIPYKIEVGAPDLKTYRKNFEDICGKHGIILTDHHFDSIVQKITVDRGMELAAYHARFIVDQVLSVARFLGIPPRLEAATIDYALNNLAVTRKAA